MTAQQLTELINRLGGDDEDAAQAAVRRIMTALPMAAMPERWPDDSAYQPPGQTTVPEWLIHSCSSWDKDNEFIALASAAAGKLHGRQLDLFFTRMAALLGASRIFTAALRKQAKGELATRFILRLTHTRMRQFPMQVCFSPTLRCQLTCSYCISAGTADDTSIEPDHAQVGNLLDWLCRQGIKRMGLSGGEPTLSPLFSYLTDETEKRGISLYMASNGIFSPQICDSIIRRQVASITLHLARETIEEKGRFAIFMRNARAMVAAGLNVALRCNLNERNFDPAIYAGHARDAGIREVRVAVPTPNAQHGNDFIEPESLQAFAEQLAHLHASCESLGISLHLAKPFPLCLLPEDTARLFLGNGSAAINCPMNQNEYANNIVVHPDFGFIPCLGLSLKQNHPIHRYTDLRQAARTYAPLVEELIRKPLFTHCPECPLWKGSRCIGTCLSYRLPENQGNA